MGFLLDNDAYASHAGDCESPTSKFETRPLPAELPTRCSDTDKVHLLASGLTLQLQARGTAVGSILTVMRPPKPYHRVRRLMAKLQAQLGFAKHTAAMFFQISRLSVIGTLKVAKLRASFGQQVPVQLGCRNILTAML